MEYHEAVERLERLRRLRPKLGTETTASLLAALDDPHKGLTAVQVAGSNGKGSTARILAAILQAAGFTVGLYTSPDLNDLRERITVDDQKIPKAAVSAFVETAWPAIADREAAGDGATFFEALTTMAYWHFHEVNVDVAVLEVGIGGRYDATSVVDPVAAAVTNVSLEHTDIIGSSIAEIARDKASVAPADRPLVTGATGDALVTIREETDILTVGVRTAESTPPDVSVAESPTVAPTRLCGARKSEVVQESELSCDRAKAKSSQTSRISDSLSHERRQAVSRATRSAGRETLSVSRSLSMVGPDWAVDTESPLLGEHQAVNAGIAAQLARQVASVSEREIATGVRTVAWPGRFEVMGEAPLVVLDGAHNPDACAKLTPLLDRFDFENLTLVFGAMRDKEHADMVRELPTPNHVYLAAPDVPRAHDVAELAGLFDAETDADIEQSQSVIGAVDAALREAGEDDCVLVTGSLYLVAEARTRWTTNPRVLSTETTEDAQSALRSADIPAGVRRERADQMVERTIRLATQREAGRRLVESMRSLGGTGAVSELGTGSRQVPVILSGSLEQFVSLLRELEGRPDGARYFADQLRRALDGRRRDAAENYPWTENTAVMGILNVTPDSFHDGGEYDAVDDAVMRAREMVDAGADIVDVGGESTRPGADPVSVADETERVVPVVEALQDLDVMVSVDTRKPEVADAALAAGADMVNDVTGLADAGLRQVVADWDVPVAAMHSLSAPVDPDRPQAYDDVVDDVLSTLAERLVLAERDGIDRSKILLDPGLGFGKNPSESFELIRRLGEFEALGHPLMVGHSHKSMFEDVTRDSDDRFASTVAATALAVANGADVVRVHDVAPNVDAVRTAQAVTDRF